MSSDARMTLSGCGPAVAWDGLRICRGDRVRVRCKGLDGKCIEGVVCYVSYDGFDLDVNGITAGILYSLVQEIVVVGKT